MLEPALIWILGAGLTATSSAALLALPALLAVRRVLAMRGAAPLPRGRLERDLVMGAGMIGALGALAWADGCALALGPYAAAETAILLSTFVAPVPLAAVSWAAGEMLSGSSLRPFASFTLAAAVATATSWLSHAALWAGQPRRPLDLTLVGIQLMVMISSSLLAAQAYLAVRGEPLASLPEEAVALEGAARDYSSSMSENRSLRGCSSGFF
jgi:hypothetical protein